MKITDENIATLRSTLLTVTGLACLIYAVMALIGNRPDPFWWYVPGGLGLLAALGITLAFAMATPDVRRRAHDEMYVQLTHRAQRHAYWVALAMYPVFAVVVFVFGLQWNTVFAVMGTMTGATYLLLLAFFEWRAS